LIVVLQSNLAMDGTSAVLGRGGKRSRWLKVGGAAYDPYAALPLEMRLPVREWANGWPHPALFPDAATAFDKQLLASQELAVMTMRCAELDGAAPAEPEDPEGVQLRASHLLVADLVEPAGSEALDKLGEGRQALGIASAWVRSNLAAGTVV